MESAPQTQQALIDRAKEALARDQRVRGVWLVGSYGRGTSDQFSDVDMWVVVEPAEVEPFCSDWARISESVTPTVLRRQIGSRPIFSQITPEWLRWDVSIGTPEMVSQRTRSTARPIYGLSAQLGEPKAGQLPNPERIESITQEFFRVLGLLPVVVGREEYALAQSGAELLRSMLIELMLEDTAVEDRGGALHLNPLLPPERQRMLIDLPPLSAKRESVIACHVACAEAFLPLARDLGRRCGLTWPQDLEQAALRHVETSLSVQIGAR